MGLAPMNGGFADRCVSYFTTWPLLLAHPTEPVGWAVQLVYPHTKRVIKRLSNKSPLWCGGLFF